MPYASLHNVMLTRKLLWTGCLVCRRSVVVTVLVSMVLLRYFIGVVTLANITRLIYGPVLLPSASYNLLDTPGCVIPGFSIHDATVQEFIRPHPKLVCSDKPAVTVSEGQLIKVVKESLVHYGLSYDRVSCCAQIITRLKQDMQHYDLNSDNLSVLSECQKFNNGEYRVQDTEAVAVKCTDKNSLLGWPFYKDVHYFFPRERIMDKVERFKASGGWSANPEQLNVVIFGTDSISRLNLERHMPKTLKRLKEVPDHLDFIGYNKIADNTDPNLIALLLGIHPNIMDSIACHKSYSSPFDDCQMIWKDFGKKGYVTVLGEDSPIMGIFHNEKSGYVNQPTDYYNRPGYRLSEDTIAHSVGIYSYYFKNCQGTKPSIKVIHDYALKAMNTFKDVPFFGLFWSASTSHETLSDPSSVDDYQAEFIDNLERLGHLNNTAIIYMSDHGLRFGKIRSTYIGSLEERLPFMFLLLPQWFSRKYTSTWQTLQTNTKRLVTNFDFYHTIQDILHLQFSPNHRSANYTELDMARKAKSSESSLNHTKNSKNIKTADQEKFYETLSKAVSEKIEHNALILSNSKILSELSVSSGSLGHSLFEAVSPHRTCKDMLIPDHYCTCITSLAIDLDSPLAISAARYIIIYLNDKLKDYPLCQRWSLQEVLLARSGGYSTSAKSLRGFEKSTEDSSSTTVEVTVSASPGGALFEATIHRADNGSFSSDIDVSRISRYDGQEEGVTGEPEKKAKTKLDCVNQYKSDLKFSSLRKYCQC